MSPTVFICFMSSSGMSMLNSSEGSREGRQREGWQREMGQR